MELEKKKRIDPLKLYYAEEYYRPIENGPSENPLLLILQASSHCNFNCIMCQRNVKVARRKVTGLGEGHMSTQLVKKLAEECRDFKNFLGFLLALYGEPLLNPNIVELVKIIREQGILVQLVTNGSKLTEDMMRKLIDAGLNKIKISFQGASREKYKLWRNQDSYDQLSSTIKSLVKIRDEMGSDLFIQVGTSSADDTMEEIDLFVKYWEQIVDHVYWNYTILLPVKETEAVKNLEVLRECPKLENKCWEPFKRLPVMWNGLVTQCLNDEENFVGDVSKQSIMDVWNGKGLTDIRHKILTEGNVLHGCENCATEPPETRQYDYRYETSVPST